MAFTEKYVSSSAGGAGTGTIGSPYTIGQMVTEINSASGTGGQGIRYNIKADGTYTRTSDDEMFGATGTNTSPIVMRGYKTTVGDGYLGRDSAGALVTTNMPVIALNGGTFALPHFSVTESINFQANRDTWATKLRQRSAMIGCRVTNSNTSSDAACVEILEFSILFECDFLVTAQGSTRCVTQTAANGARVDSCRIISQSTTCDGVRSDWQTHYYACLIKGAGGATGIYYSDSNRDSSIRNCTITGWVDGVKFDSAGTQLPSWIAGNMITDNSGYGVNFTTSTCMAIIGPNRTRDNTLGDTNNATANWIQSGRILPLTTTDTGGGTSDYVNPSGNDYNLVATSPGKGVNRPLVSDMGPYGLPDPSGGGGSAVFNPLAQTIIRPA